PLGVRKIPLKISHRHVVHVDVLARRDVLRGEADDLVVAPHRLPGLHRPHSDLVAGGHARRDGHVAFLDERGAGGELDARDDDVVGGIQADGEIGGLQHGEPPGVEILPSIARRAEKPDDRPVLRVYALCCGSLEFDRSLFFPAEAAGTKITMPVSSWLVVHPKGKLVFDTGISCEALPDPAGRLGKRVASLFSIRSRQGEDVVGQLATLGLTPDDIRYVVNSHFHFDHCGCNASFPLAHTERNRYNAKDWDHPLEYVEVDGEHDVFGDGTVVLLPTPGHTAGHQS